MNTTESTRVKRETKNTIRVDFERTSFWKRMQVKYLSLFFLQKIVWVIFRTVLLIGISYVVLFPFFAKITGSFMSPEDFLDSMVKMVPKYPTLNTYRAIIIENNYYRALFNTSMLSLACSLIQMFICTLVGYGFSKFKFKGNTLFFVIVMFTLLVPHQTIQFSLFMKFRYFDFLNIYEFFRSTIMGATRDLQINMINTYYPLIIMSLTGLAFKNGLYILVMRQAFKGIPDELEEAAYVDGAGVFRTFFTIVIPNSIPMMITIFLLSFTWQWTDEFYVELFTTETGPYLIPRIVQIPRSLTQSQAAIAASTMYQSAIRNTCGLMIIAPLIVVYLAGQRFLIEGIERTGVTG